MITFDFLQSVDAAKITAARRGAAVEKYYADLIGSIAFKFALNAGAKPLIRKAISATQTPGAGGLPRDPKSGTLKSDLVNVLRSIESADLANSDSRNFELPNSQRQASANFVASGYVQQFLKIRAHKK